MSVVSSTSPAYLVLEDGTVFEGFSMGCRGTAVGEIVFNTKTASYQDIMTDPTYYGQIVAQTYPLVGNRGVQPESSSEIMASGYIVREWCDEPTDARQNLTLDEYLKSRGIVGLCGIDTRRLTRMLRDGGYVKAAITDSLEDKDALLAKIRAYSIAGAVKAVTTKTVQQLPAADETAKMAVLDYGFNRNLVEFLQSRGISLTVFPADTAAETITSGGFDGVMLSDGPGDPDEDMALIETIRTLTKSGLPIFAVGLGHQMLAHACGMRCGKMAHAHRGSNQPVRNLKTRKIMITTQNHGYAVEKDSIDPAVADAFLENVNDHTVEALRYKQFPALSVQFEPLDGPGLQDTAWVFDEVAAMLQAGK